MRGKAENIRRKKKEPKITKELLYKYHELGNGITQLAWIFEVPEWMVRKYVKLFGIQPHITVKEVKRDQQVLIPVMRMKKPEYREHRQIIKDPPVPPKQPLIRPPARYTNSRSPFGIADELHGNLL